MTELFPTLDETAIAATFPSPGPETPGFDVAAAGLDAEAIETDAWNLRRRRLGERWRRLAERTYPEGDPAGVARLSAFYSGDERRWPRLREQLLADARAQAAENPGEWADTPLDADEIAAAVDAELKRELEQAERLMTLAGGDTGDVIAEFVGRAGAAMTDETSLALMPLGGFGSSFARTVLLEGALGATGEALILPRMEEVAARMGRPAPDPFAQVMMGAAFGASLPIAFRAGAETVRAAGRAVSNSEAIKAARERIGRLTPVERRALDKLESDEAAAAAGDGGDHVARLNEADARLERDEIAPEAVDASASASAERLKPTPPRSSGPRRRLALRIVGVEKGARPDATNPDSSAMGDGQFIEGTWLRLMRQYRPGLIAGKSEAEILAMRANSDLSLDMVEVYARENRAGLGEAGLPTHDGAVYLAHFAGLGGAKEILRAKPDTPLALVLSKKAMQANRKIKYDGKAFGDWTTADAINWARAKMGLATGNLDEYARAGVFSFDPRTLRTDAETFQYKEGADNEGVTRRLMGETVWDSDAGMGIMVYERADGTQFVADGHQRTGLARRLLESGAETDIALEGSLYRETDGWTPEMVRVLAARRNIRQETGTPLDAAKILRDHPEMRATLSFARDFMAQADGLAKLAPSPYQAVVNGVIPQHYAAIVGRLAPGDETLQTGMIAALRQTEPENLAQAEVIARQVRRMGLERRADEAQGSLFGDDFDFGQSFVVERARVMDRAIKELRADKATFARLQRDADTIEEAGNVLAKTENERRAESAARAIETLYRLADEPGPVRDALDAAARAARSGSVAQATREFLGALRSAIEGGDLGRLAARGGDRGAPTPEEIGARANARDIAAEIEGPAEDAGVSPGDLFDDTIDGPGVREEAAQLEADLRAALDEAAVEAPLTKAQREELAAVFPSEWGADLPADGPLRVADPDALIRAIEQTYDPRDGIDVSPSRRQSMMALAKRLREAKDAAPQIEADQIAFRLDEADAERTAAEHLKDLEAEADFLDQLGLCQPKGGTT